MELIGYIIVAGLSFAAGHWFAGYSAKKKSDETNGMY